jgi:hypothetical protein
MILKNSMKQDQCDRDTIIFNKVFESGQQHQHSSPETSRRQTTQTAYLGFVWKSHLLTTTLPESEPFHFGYAPTAVYTAQFVRLKSLKSAVKSSNGKDWKSG